MLQAVSTAIFATFATLWLIEGKLGFDPTHSQSTPACCQFDSPFRRESDQPDDVHVSVGAAHCLPSADGVAHNLRSLLSDI